MKAETQAFVNRVYASSWSSGIMGGLLMALSFSPTDLAVLTIPGFMLFMRAADRCMTMPQVMYLTFPGFFNLECHYNLLAGFRHGARGHCGHYGQCDSHDHSHGVHPQGQAGRIHSGEYGPDCCLGVGYL